MAIRREGEEGSRQRCAVAAAVDACNDGQFAYWCLLLVPHFVFVLYLTLKTGEVPTDIQTDTHSHTIHPIHTLSHTHFHCSAPLFGGEVNKVCAAMWWRKVATINSITAESQQLRSTSTISNAIDCEEEAKRRIDWSAAPADRQPFRQVNFLFLSLSFYTITKFIDCLWFDLIAVLLLLMLLLPPPLLLLPPRWPLFENCECVC